MSSFSKILRLSQTFRSPQPTCRGPIGIFARLNFALLGKSQLVLAIFIKTASRWPSFSPYYPCPMPNPE